MAGSKFRTMLHRNRFNRIAIVLIYTLLEWILIALISLQAVLSYFVSMYVSYFGLKPPCPLCSRVDHLFHAKNDSYFLSNVVCHDHISEISQFEIRYDDQTHLEKTAVSHAPMAKGELEAMSIKCLKCGEGLMLGIDLGDLMVKPPCLKGYDVKNESLGKEERGGAKVVVGAIKRDEEGDGAVKLSSHEEEVLKPNVRAKAGPASSLEEQQDDDDNIGKKEEDSFSSSSSSSSEEEGDKGDSSSSSSQNNAIYKVVYQCQDCASQNTEHVSKLKSPDPPILDDKYFVGLKVKNGKVRMNGEEMIRFFKEMINSEDDMRPHIFTVEIDVNHSYRGDSYLVSSVISNTIGTDGDDLSKEKVVKEVVGAKETQILSDVDTKDREFAPVEVRHHSIDKINGVSPVGEIDHASHKKVEEAENGNKTDAEVEEECKIDGETGYEVLTEREINGEISKPESEYETHDGGAYCVVSIGTEICEPQHIDLQLPETTQPEAQLSVLPKEAKMEEMAVPENIDEVLILNKSKKSEEMIVLENIDDVPSLNKSNKSEEEMIVPENIDDVPSLNKSNKSGEEMIVPENIDDIPSLNKSNKSQEEMLIPEDIDNVPSLNKSNKSEEEMLIPESIGEIQSVNKRFDLDMTEFDENESIDGSVESEGDIVETMALDDLKAALRAKQKAISCLEAELDEERSASDISADQAMAKITRLTKEMATLKMEAEQEKRLVEERFEYDREQFQNMYHNLDVLAKQREKEKQDVMKELVVYHRRVQILEGELRKQMKKSKANENGFGDDGSDKSSVELDESAGSYEGDITDMPVDDDVIMSYEKELGLAKYLSTLKELIDEFEDERYSICEQLMVAEENQGALDDDKGEARNNDNTKDIDSVLKSLEEVEGAIKLLKDSTQSLKNGDNEVDLLRSIFQHYRDLRNDDELRDSAESNLVIN